MITDKVEAYQAGTYLVTPISAHYQDTTQINDKTYIVVINCTPYITTKCVEIEIAAIRYEDNPSTTPRWDHRTLHREYLDASGPEFEQLWSLHNTMTNQEGVIIEFVSKIFFKTEIFKQYFPKLYEDIKKELQK